MTWLIGVSIAAVGLSYYGVAAFLDWAKRNGILLDLPNERSSHQRPTPRGAGLVIVVVTLSGFWLLWGVLGPAQALRPLALYTLGVALIAAVSWFDDLRSMPRWVRFAAHLLGAACGIAGFGYWSEVTVPSLGSFGVGFAGAILTLLWIVGLTNAYNFMDGIDGIAGAQAVVAGLGWGMFGLATGHPLVAGFGFLVAASSLGFLGYNWPPARVFMDIEAMRKSGELAQIIERMRLE